VDIVESFLKDDRDIFLNLSKKYVDINHNKIYEEFKKKKFSYVDSNFFKRMLENFVS
jgi:hypothetical protein